MRNTAAGSMLRNHVTHWSSWAWWVTFALLVMRAVHSTPLLASDIIIGTAVREIELVVPDPDDPTATKTVLFGEFVARLGNDRVQQTMVIGFRQTYKGAICCDALHFLNVVVSDPNPPKWKDAGGVVHAIAKGTVYVDPLSGGNIPPRQENPSPQADRLPWYDGERPRRKASTTGDFDAGEKKEYDLNDVRVDPLDWTTDPVLDLVFADGPTLTDGLEFVTLLVCVRKDFICPVAGISWGRSEDGKDFIGDVFEGTNFPAGLTVQKLTAALAASGFDNYKMREASCCSVSEPATAALAGTLLAMIAAIGLTGRRKRI